VQWVRKGRRDLLEQPDQRDRQALPEPREHKDRQGLQARLALKGRSEL
jgi:hypothetical protein